MSSETESRPGFEAAAAKRSAAIAEIAVAGDRGAGNHRSISALLSVLLAILLAATAVGLILGGGAYTAPASGIVDSGPLVGWAAPLLRALTLAASIATFGWLGYAAFLGPQQRGGLLGAGARDDIRRASNAAGIWALLALLTAAFTLAYVLGISLSEAIRPAVINQYAIDVLTVRAYLFSALFAGAIWVGARYARTLAAAAGWWILALAAISFAPLTGHAAGYGDHDLALTSGVTHTWAAAVWAGGLLALTIHAWRHDPGVVQAAGRYSNIALAAVAFLAISGIGNASTRMDTVSDLWNSGYGRLVVLKTVILVALVALAAIVRRNLAPRLGESRRVLAGFVGVELGLLATAGGLAVALAQTPYPRIENNPGTVAEQLLGQTLPAAPEWTSLVFGWQFEPLFLIGGVLAAAFYLAAVMRLRARGDAWHPGRTISWMLGVTAIIWVTNSGIALYSQVSFSVHMLAHMILAMIAPILLVMGTPITLALRALRPASGGRRGSREWLVWGINSPLSRFVTHPLWVLFVFTFGLYGLYYTPLFSWLMGSHLGHLAMQIHFLGTGYLFAYVVLGLDPAPRVLAPWLRMLMLVASMALHSFFAVPLMMTDVVFAGEWYSQVQPPWIDSLVAETRTAGGIAWGIAEVPALMLMIALAVQWSRSSDREARRHDRQANRDGEAELAAYNERLRRMNETATKHGD